ncbi:Homeobox domain-containing protein [Pleurotus pulmonarius]
MSTVITTTHASEARLHLLADVAASQLPVIEEYHMDSDSDQAGPCSSSSSSRSADCSYRLESPSRRIVGSLHISCDPYATSPSPPKPFKRPKISLPSVSRRRLSNRRSRNLLVLRMVYDQITMYPSETWMAIIAVTIRRALKQVKNWFSNERQKHNGKKDEDIVRMVSGEGERLRLRSVAVDYCKAEEWTDAFFEEVVMIHHLKVSTLLRLDESRQPRGDPVMNSPSPRS